MKILLIAGSSRLESKSARVAYGLQQYLQKNTAHQIDIIDLRFTQLPMMQKVISSVELAPAELKPVAKLMLGAEAFIWVNPEYNGTYPGSFKILVDHFPKIARKPVGICSVSTGGFGGLRSTQQMVLLTAGLFAIAAPQFLTVPMVEAKFDEQGNLLDPAFENNIKNFVTEFLWLAEKVTAQ